MNFIEKNKDQPFFCFIPTNAAHAPLNVAEKYSQPYVDMGESENRAKFYGICENIDGVKVMNIAMDYGLSGIVRCLHLFSTELDDNQSWDLSRDATCAILSLAVNEEEGTKWPLFTRLQAGKLSL